MRSLRTAYWLRDDRNPWATPWPSDDLQKVANCPVCSSAERQLLHDELVDNVFFIAPGKWTLYRCAQCNSAYLDPRPSPAGIGEAYRNYYTHAAGSGQTDFAKLTIFQRLRRKLANGYLNHRYGTQRRPAAALGVWVAALLPGLRRSLDKGFRYLPKPRRGQRLLDIGCGNGDFLVNVQEAGWVVSGLEPDPKAAAAARQRGLHVALGTVDVLANESNSFDAITLSHVIEHVHEPSQLLQAVRRLLKPGGVAYIDTPNIDSRGAHYFGKNWRGLEPPRHLVLFNPASLIALLSASGFEDIQTKRRTDVHQSMYQQSMNLSSLATADGRPPYDWNSARLPWSARIRMHLQSVESRHLEFITLLARKGKA